MKSSYLRYIMNIFKRIIHALLDYGDTVPPAQFSAD